MQLYDNLFIDWLTGIGAALQSRLAPFILSDSGQQNDVQPRSIRVLTVPEYFAEFREKGENLAAFLGSSIIAKVGRRLYLIPITLIALQVTFNDAHGKNFVSKADYVENGPRAIIEMSASLL